MSSTLNVLAVVVLFVGLLMLLGLQKYQNESSIQIARPALLATWPQYPLKEGFKSPMKERIEKFENMSLQQWLPAPEALTKKSGCDNDSPGPYQMQGKGPYTSFDLLSDWLKPNEEPIVAAGPTANECWKRDFKRVFERSSYAQRTNNYKHGSAESCSALNHDLILDFYKPVSTTIEYAP